MPYSENKEQSGEYLRLALGHLVKYDLPANPVNYTVWYEYVTGKNLKLKHAVDLCLTSNKPVDSKQFEELYKTFVADGDRVVVTRLMTKINLMLKEISSHLLETEGDLAGHGKNLGDLAEQVQAATDIDEMKELVDRMIDETRELILSGSRLKERMAVSSKDLKELAQELQKSQQEAQTDALTGLINRRGLDNAFEMERIRARQNQAPFSVILMDIDHFKQVNDTHGHLVGDSLLKGLSRILTGHLRQNDIAARFGGEEFMVILSGTPVAGAGKVARKIMEALARKEWKIKGSGHPIGKITVSMGIAEYRVNEPPDAIIQRADDALYQAKHLGRNRIVTQDELPPG